MSTPSTPTLAEFNHLTVAEASEILRACLDIDAWVARVGSGRPYPDLAALRGAGEEANAAITWDQCAGALDRHPRIGERTAAVAGSVAESAWSAEEQAGVTQAGSAQVDSAQVDRAQAEENALHRGNVAYEARFGHIFLICAAGLSGLQIRSALHRRMEHDEATERGEVMRELAKIAVLRLGKAVRT